MAAGGLGRIAGSYQDWGSPGIPGEHFQKYLVPGWGIMTALSLWRGQATKRGWSGLLLP